MWLSCHTGGMRTTRFWSSTQRKMRKSEVIKSALCPFPSPVYQITRWVEKNSLSLKSQWSAGNYFLVSHQCIRQWGVLVKLKFLETVFSSQASIRAPVGATFVPRTAHLKMIKPRIKTRAGEVIEPMSRYYKDSKNRFFGGNTNDIFISMSRN